MVSAKRIAVWTVVLGAVAAGLTATTASAAQTQTFSNPTPLVIPEVGPTEPYGTEVLVSGMSGAITDVSMTLHGLQHGGSRTWTSCWRPLTA